jgi:hypothetical protein
MSLPQPFRVPVQKAAALSWSSTTTMDVSICLAFALSAWEC